MTWKIFKFVVVGMDYKRLSEKIPNKSCAYSLDEHNKIIIYYKISGKDKQI